MNTRILSLLLAVVASRLSGADALFAPSFAAPSLPSPTAFARPPDEARPYVWWHWIHGNVSKKGITADLEAFAEQGIGGVVIFDVHVDLPEGPVAFDSPAWYDHLYFALAEAKRLGLKVTLHNCSGWSSAGGPWVPVEKSMKRLVWSETSVTDGTVDPKTLPTGEVKDGFYRDVAVLAFPTPKTGGTVAKRDIRTIVAPTKLAGDWTVLRFGYTTTAQQNHPASAAGRGYEVDKLDAGAMAAHLDRYIGKVAHEVGGPGSALTGALIDSYEVKDFDWTEGLEKRYAERWGEDLLPYLVARTGRTVGSAEETARAKWRLDTLIAQLLAKNYAGTFVAKCHEYGMKAEIQPYVSPYDDREYARYADVPQGEFWPGGKRWEHQGSSRLVPSAAHFFGRPLATAEAFVVNPNDVGGKYDFAPLVYKAGGDRTFASGINKMYVNASVHQPWDVAGPGMTFGLWGSHVSRTQPSWTDFKPFFTYLSRAQLMLQAGAPAPDVLVYNGDDPHVKPAVFDRTDYDWDCCGTSWLSDLKVVDGRPVAPSGLVYQAIILQNCDLLADSTRAVLDGLKAKGVKFSLDGIEPDFVEVPKRGQVHRLFWTHRRYSDGTEGYFVCSTNLQAVVGSVSFRQTGKRVELWDAETGTIRPAEAVAEADGRTRVSFRLDPAGSVFVIFRPVDGTGRTSGTSRTAEMEGTVEPYVLAGQESVKGPWRLSFPFGKSLTGTNLIDWAQSADDDIRYFTGRAVYETTVAAGGILDLGDVRNFAAVFLDGEKVVSLWKPPYRCTLPHGGRLRVEVTNLWPNRLIGDDRLYAPDCAWAMKNDFWHHGQLLRIPDWVKAGRPSPTGRKAFVTWRHYTKDDALRPSGLLGPVTLTRLYPRSFFDGQKTSPLDYVLAHPETTWLERAPGDFEIPFVAAFPNHWWTKGPQCPGYGLSAYPGGRLAFKRDEIRANAAKRYDAVFVGDSITHNWETLGSNVLHGVLGPYRILNIGNGNDRTSHTLWDVRNGLLDGFTTPLVVLHIGTNNANRPGAEPETAARGIAEIVRTIREKQPQAKILLMPILPRGAPDDSCRLDNERVNGLIRPLADGKTVVWLDLRLRYLDGKGGIRPGLMLDDNLHPVEAGYRVWADALLPYLQDTIKE